VASKKIDECKKIIDDPTADIIHSQMEKDLKKHKTQDEWHCLFCKKVKFIVLTIIFNNFPRFFRRPIMLRNILKESILKSDRITKTRFS